MLLTRMLYFIQVECYLLFYQQTYYFCIIFYHTNLNNEMLRGLNFVSSGRPQQLIESLKQPQFKAIFFFLSQDICSINLHCE